MHLLSNNIHDIAFFNGTSALLVVRAVHLRMKRQLCTQALCYGVHDAEGDAGTATDAATGFDDVG